MKNKIFIISILTIMFGACHSGHDHSKNEPAESNVHQHNEGDMHEHAEGDVHEHTKGDVHEHAEGDVHEHAEGDEHSDHKIQLTAYSAEFELFAEADIFVVGEASIVLSHFTNLSDFKALEYGKVSIRLVIDGEETIQTLDEPTRKGIYSFDIIPETEGAGEIIFDIATEKGNFQIVVPDINVYACEHEAPEESVPSSTNAIVFTKEQSWKLNFATELPRIEQFGQTIKTIARVQSAQGDEILVSAKTNGIILLTSGSILEGMSVVKGEKLFSISGSELADNNSAVRFTEAQNNFEIAKSDYERKKELAKDKIISEKDLLNAKNQYDNARVVYNNLNKNFDSSGQHIISPMSGYVKQMFVQNGEYVESGQAIISISQNKTLILIAEVQQKYASILGAINSANIRTLYDNQTYSLNELNGKVLSYGKSTNNDNYLIPVSLQIDNSANFISGSFVEVYLKTLTNSQALTIPNTALLEEQDNFFVLAQITPELFEKREVMTGASDGLRTEIVNGITLNERVVTKGAILVKLAQAAGALDAHSGHVH